MTAAVLSVLCKVSQAAESPEGLASFQRAGAEDWRLQWDGAAAGTDGQQSHEDTALETHGGVDRDTFRRRERQLYT